MIMIRLGDSLGSMVTHDGIVGIGRKNIQLHLDLVFHLLWEVFNKILYGHEKEGNIGLAVVMQAFRDCL